MITIKRNEETLGSYESDQIVKLIQAGQLAGSDLAQSEGAEKWEPLDCLHEFSGLFQNARPTAIRNQGELLNPRSSNFITTLCIFSVIGSIFGLLRGMFYEGVSSLFEDQLGEPDSFWRGWTYIGLNAGTLIGAIMMFGRLALGRYIYTGFQIVYILMVGYSIIWSDDYFLITAWIIGATFALPSLIFVYLFWLPRTRGYFK